MLWLGSVCCCGDGGYEAEEHAGDVDVGDDADGFVGFLPLFCLFFHLCVDGFEVAGLFFLCALEAYPEVGGVGSVVVVHGFRLG